MDTASTFKLGVFPYPNDPQCANGNGANGPCSTRGEVRALDIAIAEP